MSETKEAPKPFIVKRLKENCTVTVEIPAFMYKRIQNLFLAGVPFKDLESLQKVLASIKNSNSDPDVLTYHTRTLMMLLSDIEEAAEKQGKIDDAQITPAG